MRGPDGRIQLEDDNANAVQVARGLLNIDDEGNDLPESKDCAMSPKKDREAGGIRTRDEGGTAP